MRAPTLELRAADAVGAAITAHPWTAVAVAVAAGACVALAEARAARSSLGRSIIAIVGSTTLALVRELATRHGPAYARSWLQDHAQPRAA